jgi:hypothetical protein
MALAYSSDQVTNRFQAPPASPHSAGEVYVANFEVALDADLAANDLVGLAAIPPDCIPVDICMIVPDLDTGTVALLFDVGILNAAKTDLVPSSLLIDGSTAGQAGGVARMDDYECAYEPATWLAEATSPEKHEEKIVALKVMTAAATAAAGTIRGHVLYRAAFNGV